MDTAWYAPVQPTTRTAGRDGNPNRSSPAQYAGDIVRRVRATPPPRTLRNAPPSIVTALAAALVAIALGGCISIHDPDTNNPTPTTHSTSRQAAADPVPVHERGGTHPRRRPHGAEHARRQRRQRHAAGRARALRDAVVQLDRRHGHLPSASSSRRSRSARPARKRSGRRELRSDSTLASSQVANSGQVIAIAPELAGAAGDWVVVTREPTTGQGDYQGLPATLHVTYAQLTHTPDGFVVSLWAPQN